MFQENLSVIEPDNSFEFQKEIENYINTPGNFNIDNSLQSEDITSNIQPTVQTSHNYGNNLVMIDQAQLLELMQAKQILDAQKAAQSKAQAEQEAATDNLLSQGFNSAVFLTPPKTLSNQNSPSTQSSTHGNTILSQVKVNSIKPFVPGSVQLIRTQPENQNSLFQKPLFSNDIPMNFMKQNSNYCNLNKQTTNRLDSRFENELESQDQSILGKSAQGRAIGNDLLNLIDCNSSQDTDYQQTPMQSLVRNYQNLNIGEQYSSPDSNEYSNQSSSLNGSGNDNSPKYAPTFQGCYQPTQYIPQTVNNIVINNFVAPVAPTMSAETVKAPAFKPNKLYFKPLEVVSNPKPTLEQQAELAQATQKAGGVRPLHMKDSPDQKTEDQTQDSEDTLDMSRNLYDFPEGGWECSKCQNYNFKGRKECYRCKKSKNDEDCEGKPKHMSLAKLTKKQKKAAKAEKEALDQSKLMFANKWASNNDYRAPKEKQTKKTTQPRMGDWTCQRCFNHNFSFRDVCNMCYMGQVESNRMLYEQAQTRFMSVQQPMQQQWQPQMQYQQMQMPVAMGQFPQYTPMPQMEQFNVTQ